MDKELLRSIIARAGDTQNDLAKVINITPQSLSSKINEKNGAEFTQSEITSIKRKYNLNANQIEQIFFNNVVSYKDTHKARDAG